MILWTHMMMAEQVYRRLVAHYGNRLDRAAFVRGNLLPDLNRKYRNLSHHTEDCWSLLESLTVEMDGLLCGTERGSERLGIICHFISDFFCSVHNPPFSERMSLVEHLLYEHRLDRRLRRLMRNEGLEVIWNQAEGDFGRFDSGRHWVAEGLPARHKAYARTVLSLDLDIREAMRACADYCGMMIALEDRQLSPFNTKTTLSA